MITTPVTNMEWDEPPSIRSAGIPVGWLLSLVLHTVGLTLLWFWLKASPTPQNTSVMVTLNVQQPVAPAIPVEPPKPVSVAPIPPKPVAVPSANKSEPNVSEVKTVETEVVTTGESGLFRYDNEASVSVEQALHASRSANSNPTAAFDPRINRQRQEAQRLANLAPAIKAEAVKTEQTIAGQTLVRTETGCAVLLETVGADRLDGALWAYAPCGNKSGSDQFADRLREAMTNRGGR
ncbi:hypothetical protein QFX18_01530 [Saccharophagus degradans]|uniref:hypothetical protein n=1 Tax=Saccharophagus degradans TaxID=86304 RepID=UPI002477E882|nr:hypothetical protein [Saccharophagus degradans]WGO98741.1 hypothetical protein QFX18_01530 [Saccharophagus degradans]